MARRFANIAGFGVLAVLAVGMGIRYGSLGDYKFDAAPAFEALARGRLHEFFTSDALMGPFALLARAPFVLAANLGDASCSIAIAGGPSPACWHPRCWRSSLRA